MSDDPRGMIIQQGNTMRINNARVEEVSCNNNANGFLLVSYSVPSQRPSDRIQNIRLNVNRNTVILNRLGQRVGLCNIQRGTWINAIFSSSMTRSIPPQANAFLIIIQRQPQNAPLTTTDRIASIDRRNDFLYTGNPNNINSQIRFVITDRTSITDRRGRTVLFRSLRPGQLVRITHANFQTASIPPQTTAFRVEVLS